MLRAHQGAVRAFLRRLTGETMRADELAQETFFKAYRVGTPSDMRAPRSWLYRIAYRLYLDDRRRDTRREALMAGAPEPQTIHVATSGSGMDIARAMDALTPERRACALLCLALGHSHAEAASITGLPLGTVKSHVSRARISLQAALSDYRPADRASHDKETT